MFGKAITYKTTTKCLADNRTAKYEASVGPAENLPPLVRQVRQISKTIIIISSKCNLFLPWYGWKFIQLALNNNRVHSRTITIIRIHDIFSSKVRNVLQFDKYSKKGLYINFAQNSINDFISRIYNYLLYNWICGLWTLISFPCKEFPGVFSLSRSEWKFHLES